MYVLYRGRLTMCEGKSGGESFSPDVRIIPNIFFRSIHKCRGKVHAYENSIQISNFVFFHFVCIYHFFLFPSNTRQQITVKVQSCHMYVFRSSQKSPSFTFSRFLALVSIYWDVEPFSWFSRSSESVLKSWFLSSCWYFIRFVYSIVCSGFISIFSVYCVLFLWYNLRQIDIWSVDQKSTRDKSMVLFILIPLLLCLFCNIKLI